MPTNSPPPISTTHDLTTQRLTLRPWRVEDAQAALDIYGHAEVTRWLSPDMDRVPNLSAMRLLLQQWIAEDARLPAPAGRWAIHTNTDDRVIGGAILLPLPPDLQVFRLRIADLNQTAPEGHHPLPTPQENPMTDTTFITRYEQRVRFVQNVLQKNTTLDDKTAHDLAVQVVHAIDHIPEPPR